jgi:hypothetical protein
LISSAQVGKKGENPTATPTPTPKSTAKKSSSQKTGKRSAVARRDQGKSVEQTYWESIKDSTNPEDFSAYLQKYPSGEFKDIARNRISSLEAAERKREAEEAKKAENAFWESVKNSKDTEDFRAYLRKYPNGEFADLARNRIDSLKASSNSTAQTNQQSSKVSDSGVTFKACDYQLGSGLYNKWLEVKQNASFVCPIMNEDEAGQSPQGTTGRYAQFSNKVGGEPYGFIVWHRTGKFARNTFIVYGCNFKLYSQLGGTLSWLGFPTSDEYDAPGGRRNDFEGGYIYWNEKNNVCQAYKR